MFTVTLVRTPFLPPTFAKFLVPLHFNKLDMRDYLWHVYGIETVGTIRSYVQQQPLRMDKPGAVLPRQRNWYRERSIKKMTVEMDRPFVWPEAPEDLSPYVSVYYLLICTMQVECSWRQWLTYLAPATDGPTISTTLPRSTGKSSKTNRTTYMLSLATRKH